MIYRKQAGFDAFKCIADKCPKSCCIGWQIMIDENSVDKYSRATGDFGQRLKNSINYEEGCFLQNGIRCSMLNNNGLCDLQSTLGEEYLCDTCRLYPRHTEEFQDIREYSLSLSCPEVTRMIMEPDYKFAFTESEDNLIDDSEEFEDFDLLLFDKLEYARDRLMKIASDTATPLQDRISNIVDSSLELQNLFDEGDIFGMDDVEFRDKQAFDFEYCLKSLDTLLEMEVLEESWTKTIQATKDFWKNKSATSPEWKAAMYPEADTEFVFSKVLQSLLFTYFCGAVYDGQIYARTMIATQSVRWLMMIYEANKKDLRSTIYLYSREVEHSDLNVNQLIEFFEADLENLS